MTGSFPLTIETPDAIATQVLNVLFYGLPVEQLQSFRERVNAVTADDVAARGALLPAARSAVDRAGRQRRGVYPRSSAARLRHVRSRRNGQPGSDDAGFQAGRCGRDRARWGRQGRCPGRGRETASRRLQPAAASYQQSSAINPQAGPEARALLEKVIAAKGGLETLRGVKSITARTRAEMPEPPPGAARGAAAAKTRGRGDHHLSRISRSRSRRDQSA